VLQAAHWVGIALNSQELMFFLSTTAITFRFGSYDSNIYFLPLQVKELFGTNFRKVASLERRNNWNIIYF
jgi:hypothetical protein